MEWSSIEQVLINGSGVPLSETSTEGVVSGFVNAVTVWINKPHVVNRRLCGSRINHFEIVPRRGYMKIVKDILLSFGYIENDDTDDCKKPRVDFQTSKVSEVSGLADVDKNNLVLILRELLPKQPERHRNLPELVIYDKSKDTFTFVPLKCLDAITEETRQIEVAYSVSFLSVSNSRISLSTSCADYATDSDRKLSLTWIKNQLLSKLARWSEEANLNTSLTSLKLLTLEEYSRLYSELKNKYGLHFAKVWPEKTDPQKFVFEDVAIATYLLLLWKQDRDDKGLTRKQSFVDLGCGNGLLVHILASEGHPGYGIDVRKRKIWDLYGPETILKEMSITPSSESVFPDCDWLIGNHSDELTPWIPVMAARSAYSCCYFVLPCCYYDFNAKFSHDTKFLEGNTDDGQYRCYLNYVKTVGEKCGFTVEEDMLRIPSTKRVCFVGRSRSYEKSSEAEIDQLRQDFISSRCLETTNGLKSLNPRPENSDENIAENWVKEFTPRSKVETTRNCVAIRQETKHTVINTVFSHLLDCDEKEVKQGHDGNSWRKGGSVPICDIVKMFDRVLLQEMKSECGGLQTLLKNNSNIFQVSSGMVQLRDFTLDNPFEGRKNKKKLPDSSDFTKTGLCWFHDNHPDGCPRASDKCMYAHGSHELRPKPVKTKMSMFSSL